MSKNVVVKKSFRKSLPDPALEIVAARFKVLSDPLRLRLLQILEAGEKNVTQLVESTGYLQPSISKHLAILTNAGMVGRRKEGSSVFYYIADKMIFELCALMCSKLQKEFDQKAEHFA